MAFKRPGTFVLETAFPSISTGDSPAQAITAFLETAFKGPTTPTRVTSWSQFLTLYGGFSGTTLRYLPYAVYQYFNNGGSICYVSRVLGSGATKATATLVDRAATPQATLTVTAINEGTWGSAVWVKVLDRSTDRFDLQVMVDGSTDDRVVERWNDLSMDATDARYVEKVINSSTQGSQWVVVADALSVTVAPSDRPSIATTQLSGGGDGSAPISAAYAASLRQFDVVRESLVLNFPGNSTNAVLIDAVAYCEGRGDCFLVCDTTKGLTAATAIVEAGSLTASSYAAVYFPWLYTLDAASTTPGQTVLLPPGGAVCGVIAATDLRRGPFKAPAGLDARIAGITALESQRTDSELDDLNSSNVNAIRHHPTGGIVIFGARTLKRSSKDIYIPVRRNLIYLKDNLKRLTDFAVFEPNNATTWGTLADRCSRFLNEHWSQGGLVGGSPAEAFYVTCDETVNTPQTISAGEVHVEVGVSLVAPAEFVVLKIGQWEGGQTTFEVA